MENIQYKAFVVEELNGNFTQSIKILNTKNFVSSEVLIRVHYSSINYKDALSATGNKGVTKKYPHTPGIDAAGVVEQSTDSQYSIGDEVIVTGYDLGMNTSGGFGQYICVPAEWIVKLPKGLTLKEAMIIGTAGFTAGISISRLTEKISPNDGNIIVSGATGGVGSVALSILHKVGYQTIAISGKETEYPFLFRLGASQVISRTEFQTIDNRPMLSARYAGGIDTVGGPILENIVKSLQPLGLVTTCGSVSSTQLNMSVFPFILRGISLVGVSSQSYPKELRIELWNKLANEWKPENIFEFYNEIGIEEIKNAIDLILLGKLKGRTIVNMN
ncbi:MAG: YhdH/YhfP family quinone oxidoreductase [Paludibacter sp.]